MIFLRFIFSLFIIIVLLNCNSKKEERIASSENVVILNYDTLRLPKETKGLTGKQLSLIYCQQCHSYPEPNLLPKEIWKESVLPQMAFRLGTESVLNPIKQLTFRELEILYKNDVIPDRPLISKEDWKKIEEYYIESAPDSLDTPLASVAGKGTKGFKETIPLFNRENPVNVTMLKFDSATSSFYVGDSDKKINVLSKSGQFEDTLNSYGEAVDFYISKDKSVYALNIGNVNPSDLPLGNIKVIMHEKGIGSVSRKVIDNLKRPVAFSFADLNQDGKEDVVVSNFGYYTGSLVWYEQGGNDVFEEHILRPKPGAQKTVITDLNGDELPDIIALMSQGDEGIFAYYNSGNGVFKEERLLRFPPVYGSNHFDLVDFNNDGHLDILYVNGDNADYSISLKKYHGVSIYLNDGQNNFEKKWSYPLYGATKAIAKDFDQDGDIDIAAIAFFADFDRNNPIPYVYLENNGNFNFTPSTLANPSIARWLTMETGDFDNDGDEDIVLGKYLTSPSPIPASYMNKWRTSSPYILILDNQLKGKK